MSDFLQRIEKLSPKRLALLALEQHDQLEEQSQPIAVIGMSCRFPGGASLDDYWRLLHGAQDAVREVPRDRWDIDRHYDPDPDAPGKMSTRWGGFVEDIDKFDASFFGISRREALTMDPQQRLILELAWEALEHAGLSPRSLDGTATGVFAGLATSDYRSLISSLGEDEIDAYFASGTAHSVAAGRISYFLGIHGPNLAIDTACSSSLVAVHYACQSLRTQECRVAIAAGVNAVLSPNVTTALSKSHMMASDGRCKTFDSRADGFVRGEGCGVLVFKRLRDAQADGNRILAVIRGSAVNQDGRSSGLTAPNGAAQQAVIQLALAAAKADPRDIGYIEAHGTGTALGDPIEAHALAKVFANRTEPLVVGSVKTNIGHLEAAAGVAGLIKVILSMQHEWIPAHLHWKQMNPHIDWNGLPVEIPVQGKPWPRSETPRLAGVSSFGFSGTNAHVIVEEAPLQSPPPVPDREWHVLAISAKTEPALEALSRAYQDSLQHQDISSVCFTAGAGRTHFDERIAVIGRTTQELREKLASGLVSRGSHRRERPKQSFHAVDLSGDLGSQNLAQTLADLYVSGVDLDWIKLYPSPLPPISLPSYPFQRQRFWLEPHVSDSPLTRIDAAVPIFETRLHLSSLSFIREHQLNGIPVVPPSFYIELALQAHSALRGSVFPLTIKQLRLIEALHAPASPKPTRLQIIIEDNGRSFRILSATSENSEWILHATGSFDDASSSIRSDLAALRARCTDALDPNAFYEALQGMGIDLGPSIRGLRRLFTNDRECLAHVVLDPCYEKEVSQYNVHPAFLDSWLQAFGASVWAANKDNAVGPRTLTSIDSFTLRTRPPAAVWVHAWLSEKDQGRLTLMDESDTTIASIEGIQLSAPVTALRIDAPVTSNLPLNVLEVVRGEIAAVLRLQPEEVDPEMGLFELGMDSLMSVELVSRLERQFQRKLSNTVTFNYSSVSELAAYLTVRKTDERDKLPGTTPVEPSMPPTELSDDLSADDLAGLLSRKLEGIH